MLDVTDNLREGRLVPPADVVRYDDADPYLVVAADKGTAHLSDVANEISGEYGFWLGDAFASGGSYGYDHKKYGITARGGWECVKRHFREVGKDIQAEPFTVAGIGDMSGDVFGNGMLLSRQIRLVAAFDHRHVFLDPDPDPETSFAERERLFHMPRSSWADYDTTKLSPGAMVVPRSSKEVELTPQVHLALGLPESTRVLDGEGLVRAVLGAPVELLWNGGIGTYVRHEDETNAEVGDPSNDPVRVRAEELRCQVIGEGGNLGLTQRARIAFALRGGRLNTDALDNSAGVDMSDHEVNLKILLEPLVQSGELTFDDRNALLERMGADVTRLVLRHNTRQSLAVSLDLARSRDALNDFAALITGFEKDRLLERVAEGIPSSEEIADRAREGIGLTRPTLCVLLAYAKLHAQSHLLASSLPDDPLAETRLRAYFPRAAGDAAGDERLRLHRLRREIITTQLVNELVDLMGASYLHRVARDTGRSIDAVARGWFIANSLAGARELRRMLEAAEARYPADLIYGWYFELAGVLERTTAWVMANVDPGASLSSAIDDLQGGVERLRAEFAQVAGDADQSTYRARVVELAGHGVDPDLADRVVTLSFLPELLDILRVAREARGDPLLSARAYYTAGDRLALGWLQAELRSDLRDSPWEKRLAQTLEADLQRARRTISRNLVQRLAGGESPDAALEALLAERSREARRYLGLIEELRATEPLPVAGAAMAVRSLVALAGAG
jgi:glutamate dehydrogenase